MTRARDLADSAQKANFLDNVTSDVNTSLTDNATAAANAVLPAGLILPFGNSSAPTGFLACEGQEELQSAYPALYAAIGTAWGTASSAATHFKLPDLRGAFLRGTGSQPLVAQGGSGETANGSAFAGPSVGSFENDSIEHHNHFYRFADGTSVTTAPTGGSGYYVGSFSGSTAYQGKYTDDAVYNGRGGDETRPFNAGILYCIKT